MIWQVDVPKLRSGTSFEHPRSRPHDEVLWKHPIRVQMSPGMANLAKEYVESAGGQPVLDRTTSCQCFEQIRTGEDVLRRVDIKS